MLKVKKTRSIKDGEGIHYFNTFDMATTMQTDALRMNQEKTQLPDKEQISIFYQAVSSSYRLMPGEPFATFFRVVEKRYQLLQQVFYFKTELFNYLENFIKTILQDTETQPETLYDAYINICMAIPEIFRDLGKE